MLSLLLSAFRNRRSRSIATHRGKRIHYARQTHCLACELLEQKKLLAVDTLNPMTTVNVHATAHFAEEGSSTALLTFLRDSDVGAESISFTLSGSATAGTDFVDIGNSVAFEDGQSAVSIVINPRADGVVDDLETIVCTIQDTGSYSIGPNASAEIQLRDAGYVADGFVAPLAETFFLNSKPDAEHTVYLDFFGGNYYTYNTILKYNTDGDSAGFSSAELHEIQRIWAGIAEDFAPFDLNVTTEAPEDGALVKSGVGDATWGVSLLVGEETTGYGFAWSGSEFSTDTDFPGYISINSPYTGGYYPLDLIAAGGSHEIGHTMGLSHDGPGGGGYYSGHSTDVGHWNPIMGQANSGLTQWSKGEYANATNLEDDLSVIASDINGINYIVDDHAGVIDFATQLVSLTDQYNTLYGRGVIHKPEDVDWFAFEHAGGALVLNVDAAMFSPNLHAGAWLFDAAGAEVAASVSTRSQSAALVIEDLAAGRYYVKVDGIGNSTGGAYSDYGSLGHYTISTGAAVIAEFNPAGESAVADISGASALTSVTLSSLSSEGFSDVYWSDVWALGWSGGVSIDPSQYISFSVTPSEAGMAIAAEVLQATFYSLVSGTTEFVLRTSQDHFQADVDVQSISGNQIGGLLVFDLSSLDLLEEVTEFRLFSRGGGAGFRYLTGDGWSYGEQGQGLSVTGRLVDTAPANPNNNSPTGVVAISGYSSGVVEEDDILTADPSALADADGLGQYSFQWNADNIPLLGETSSALIIAQRHVGKSISVTVSYVDGLNTREAIVSQSTPVVSNVNDSPVGTVNVVGQRRVGSELTADISLLSDEDGIDGASLSYQWQRNDTEIVGATEVTYVLTDADLNAHVSVVVSYQDDYLNSETVTSSKTVPIEDSLPLPIMLARFLPDFEDADQGVGVAASDPGVIISDLGSANHFGSGIDDVWALYWNGGGLDLSEYIGFTVTPSGQSKVYPERIVVSMVSEASGDTTLTLRSSLDSFATDVGSILLPGFSAASTVEFDLRDFQAIDTAVEFRIYATGGGAAYRKLIGTDFAASDTDEGLCFYGSLVEGEASAAITLSSATIAENLTSGTPIGDFSTTGGTADTGYTYSLVSGVGDTGNSFFKIVGTQLRSLDVLDHEAQESYDIRVRSVSVSGTVVEKPFTIVVADVNEQPSVAHIEDLRIIEGAEEQSIAVEGISSGDGVTQSVRVTAASSNPILFPSLVVTYQPTGTVGGVAFSPAANEHGTATITVTVEDGGSDNDLETAGDNLLVTQAFDVTVLEVLANGGAALLARDGAEKLYVGTVPVTLDGQHVATIINGFEAFGLESSGSENCLLVRRAGVEYRLVSEDTWGIVGLFDSLLNRTPQTLNVASRGIVVTQVLSSPIGDLTLRLREHSFRSSVAGEFEVLVLEDGQQVTWDPGPSRTYVGVIEERSDSYAVAYQSRDGSLKSVVFIGRGVQWWFRDGDLVSTKGQLDYGDVSFNYPEAMTLAKGYIGDKTYEFGAGYEMDYTAFQKIAADDPAVSSGAVSATAAAFESLEFTNALMSVTFTYSAKLRPLMTRVIIWKDAVGSPYGTANASGVHTGSNNLSELREHWEASQADALDYTYRVALMNRNSTGGVAYAPGRFATNNFGGIEEFHTMYVFLRHEWGHTFWVNDYDGGYRDPEDPGNTIALPPEGKTIQNGNRYARWTGSALMDIALQRGKDINTGLLTEVNGSFGQISLPPQAVLDLETLIPGKTYDLDVLANDLDANNDGIRIVGIEAVSNRGVPLALVTDQGGRQRVRYQPNGLMSSGFDRFVYRIEDSTGRTGEGVVFIRVLGSSPWVFSHTDVDNLFSARSRSYETKPEVSNLKFYQDDAWAEWNIEVPEAGDYQLSILYASTNGGQKLTVAANGVDFGTFTTLTTSDADNQDELVFVWSTPVTANLAEGLNRIRLAGVLEGVGVGGNTMVRELKLDGSYDPNSDSLPPYFRSSLIRLPDAMVERPYAFGDNLAGYALDPNPSDVLTFVKVEGADWLQVGSDGTLSGAPSNSDFGINQFVIRVTDSDDNTADATFVVPVLRQLSPARYEIEDGSRHGVPVKSSNSGYSGTGYGDYDGAVSDAYAEIETVYFAEKVTVDLRVRYANGSSDRPLALSIDGTVEKTSLSFPSTGGWETWGFTETYRTTLDVGKHTIRLTDTGASGGNLDFVEIAIVETPLGLWDDESDGGLGVSSI